MGRLIVLERVRIALQNSWPSPDAELSSRIWNDNHFCVYGRICYETKTRGKHSLRPNIETV